MSKEIRFRVWDKDECKYVDGVGDLYVTINEVGTKMFYLEQLCPGRYVIELSTGLKDKNGKEICVGDIVKFGCSDQTPAEVVYEEGSYFVKAIDDGTLFYDPETNKPCPLGWLETYGLEVIDNIHENKNLPERRKDVHSN